MTACWPCNSGKADFRLDELGWELLSEAEVRSAWDGLTRSYSDLWDGAGRPDAQYHSRWLRALGAGPQVREVT